MKTIQFKKSASPSAILLIALATFILSSLNVKSQWNPIWYPAPGFNPGYVGMDPMIADAPPWAMGGNQVGPTPNGGAPADYACGTSDGNPFSLMANGQLMLNIDQTGRIGIGTNHFPSVTDCRVDIRGSGSNFRMYGDANGTVHGSAVSGLKLHYGNTNLGFPEFHINQGTPGSAITRMLFNTWGAHIHTGGTFGGLFIGPSSSPWYNNTNGNRIWLDAINSGGLVAVGGNGNNALAVFNSAGAGRFEMKINSGGGNDTKFKLGGSAQFGFYNSVATFEDASTRVNVEAFGIDGVKVTTNGSNVKAFYVNNSNFASTTSNAFVVYGDGRTQIGPNFANASGVAANAALTVNGMILAKEVRISLATGTHWQFPDYVFAKDYKLASLNEVEDYISKNSHLPDVPSEAEVMKNGMGLAEMDITLLKKVEELFLYTIELKKQNEKLQLQIEKLDKEVKASR
ncbi:MAG: hypothetical protein K0S32_4191 [Bacteroidetes bacterium]|jgi:hypothetical protein|nr:hypothetical protein [Bacteroidota bacterium]